MVGVRIDNSHQRRHQSDSGELSHSMGPQCRTVCHLFFTTMACRLHGRQQARSERGAFAPPGNVVKCFRALVTNVVESLIRRNVCAFVSKHAVSYSAYGGSFAPRLPPQGSAAEPNRGTFVPRPPNLATPGKNPSGAHGHIRAATKSVSFQTATNTIQPSCDACVILTPFKKCIVRPTYSRNQP